MPVYLIAEEGPHRGLVFTIKEKEERIIGRDPDEAFFVLEDPTVSRRQARLISAPEGLYLENLSRISPTLINEEPIDGHVLLKEGDRIQIGRTIFLFSEKEPPAKKEKSKKKEGYEEIFGALDESLEPFARDLTHHTTRASSSGYETIFEDKMEDEALAFHLLAETAFLLKVVSGPNVGAEIGLEKNKQYILGKDPLQADIVFQDLSVSRKHAKLSIDENGIVTIEDLGSKNGTFVESSLIDTKTVISQQEMVTLGTSSFYVLDRESPQETIYSSLPSFAKEEKKEEEPAIALEQSEPLVPEESNDWKKKPIPLQYLVIAGSLLTIGLILFITLFSLFKSNPIETAAKEPDEILKKALSKFEGVEFSFNPASQKLFLVGHLLTSVDLEEMLYRVEELDFVATVENHVVIDELVTKMMNDLLSSNAAFKGIVIQTQAPGRFVVIGSVETLEISSSLSDYLAINFPYLDRLESQVSVQEVVSLQIQSLLLQKGFAALSFQLMNQEVILSGNYSNQKEEEFALLLKEIRLISGIRGIKNYALATNANQAAIDLSESFKVTGTALYNGVGYSAILNGRIYEVGSFISNMMITEIDPNTIFLEKDGIKYKINYTP